MAKIKPTSLRIIGGDLRGRPVMYHGADFTRPMKDSVRENLFNIVGPAIRGMRVFDLFAGTGILAIESISRGASEATAIEAVPRAGSWIRKSAEKLGVSDRLTVVIGDTFRLATRMMSIIDSHAAPHAISPSDHADAEMTDAAVADERPWLCLLCPPYRMWEDTDDLAALCTLIDHCRRHAPPGSILVTETEKSFDSTRLPNDEWDFRTYGRTTLGFIEPGNRCGLRDEFI
ncbi:MAG: RsmD family RNA methyltransferase [Planctomycetota bacterium]